MLDRDFPPDVRVEKEVYSLIQRGHEVHIISMNKKNRNIEEDFAGIRIHRLRWIGVLPVKINRIANFPHFLNWRWLFKTINVIRKYQIDVIHVHDLPLAPLAIIAGKMFSLPVVFDNHENYPAFLCSTVGYRGILLNLLFNPLIFAVIDRICKQMANFLLCTAEESKSIMVKQGIPSNKVFVLMNTVNLESYCRIKIDDGIVKKYNSFYTITYVGGFGKHRNLELPIRALPKLVKKIPEVRLIIVGGDEKRKQSLMNLASNLGVEKFIFFTGWVHQERVPSYIQVSKICIIPHLPSLHTNTTTPNKLFQYMALAKPVISTPIVPVKSIIEKEQCGIIVSAFDPGEFTDAVVKLFSNENLAQKIGENGRNAVQKNYNWSQTSISLIELYRNIKGNNYGSETM